jgi:hypothetical protein
LESSDIWQFGVLGLILGFYQYYLVLRHHRRIKFFRKNSFTRPFFFPDLLPCRGIPTGGSWFDPGIAIASFSCRYIISFTYVELHPERGYRLPFSVLRDCEMKNDE